MDDEAAVIARAQGAGYRFCEGVRDERPIWWFDHDTDPLPKYCERRLAISYMDLRLGQMGRTFDGPGR